MKILVVEDERELARQINTSLRNAGFLVDWTANGQEAQHLGSNNAYDAVILDLMLPLIDGLTVLGRWREAGIKTPVLILSARSTWREKVIGLRIGADDYLAKPFELEELIARIEALIRRTSGHSNPVLSCGPLLLDQNTKRVVCSGDPIHLTALEIRLLTFFMHHQNRVVSKSELADHVYGNDFDRDFNTLEVLIARIRKKLPVKCIITHRGLGYRLVHPDDIS